MVTVVREPSFGENLGNSLGTGISSALEQLANNKIEKIRQQQEQQRMSQGLQALLGLSPELASQAAGAPPDVLKEFSRQKLQEPRNQAYLQALQQVIGGGESVPGQMNSQSLIAAGISPKEATDLIKLGAEQKHRKDILKQREQQHYEKLNAPILSKIEEKAVVPREIKKLAEDSLKILKSGKALTGVKGKITPSFLQSPEGQELATKLNNIVIKKASLGKGIPSVSRLKLEEGSKAAIWNHPKVIESILKDIIHDPEINKDIAHDLAREELLEKSDLNPKDLKKEITKRAKEIQKESIKQSSQESNYLATEFNLSPEDITELESPELKENAEVEIGDGRIITKKNGQWILKG